MQPDQTPCLISEPEDPPYACDPARPHTYTWLDGIIHTYMLYTIDHILSLWSQTCGWMIGYNYYLFGVWLRSTGGRRFKSKERAIVVGSNSPKLEVGDSNLGSAPLDIYNSKLCFELTERPTREWPRYQVVPEPRADHDPKVASALHHWMTVQMYCIL